MEWKPGRDASVLRRCWAWGGMLAGVCLRSTSLCYSTLCHGKVSEETLHVGCGCEAFHLETNAFRWLSFRHLCVHVSLRNKVIVHVCTFRRMNLILLEKVCICESPSCLWVQIQMSKKTTAQQAIRSTT